MATIREKFKKSADEIPMVNGNMIPISLPYFFMGITIIINHLCEQMNLDPDLTLSGQNWMAHSMVYHELNGFIMWFLRQNAPRDSANHLWYDAEFVIDKFNEYLKQKEGSQDENVD